MRVTQRLSVAEALENHLSFESSSSPADKKSEAPLLSLLLHVYAFAETYTVLLVWIVIPLGFYAAYLWIRNRYGLFKERN